MTGQDHNKLLEICQALIRAKSVSGKGKQEADAAAVLKKYMVELGYDKVWVDEAGNVIGKIQGVKDGPSILFDGHLDTVDALDPDMWSYDPFSGQLIDNKIYGRGTSDNKGSIAAMTWGVAHLNRNEMAGNAYVSGSILEETAEGALFEKVLEQVKPDLVIIGEASNLNLCIGQRGRAEIWVETEGVSGHASDPKTGVNAVYKMADTIKKVYSDFQPTYHQDLGYGIIELTEAYSLPSPSMSVIPNYCKATYDRRLLVGETREGVIEEIEMLLEDIKIADPDYVARVLIPSFEVTTYTGYKTTVERYAPAWMYSGDGEIVTKIKDGLKEIGLTPQVTTWDWCTNGSASAGKMGIPTLGFGPGDPRKTHNVDENIEVEELVKAAKGFLKIAERLLSQN